MTQFTVSRKPHPRTLNNFVDELFNDMAPVFKSDFNRFVRNETVPVNVKEIAEGYRMEIVAPGFEKADFIVKVEKDLLTVSVEKKDENESMNEKLIRREYRRKAFKRSFTIDEKIDATKIEASYVNGVLVLNLPRKEEVKTPAQQIEIK